MVARRTTVLFFAHVFGFDLIHRLRLTTVALNGFAFHCLNLLVGHAAAATEAFADLSHRFERIDTIRGGALVRSCVRIHQERKTRHIKIIDADALGVLFGNEAEN